MVRDGRRPLQPHLQARARRRALHPAHVPQPGPRRAGDSIQLFSSGRRGRSLRQPPHPAADRGGGCAGGRLPARARAPHRARGGGGLPGGGGARESAPERQAGSDDVVRHAAPPPPVPPGVRRPVGAQVRSLLRGASPPLVCSHHASHSQSHFNPPPLLLYPRAGPSSRCPSSRPPIRTRRRWLRGTGRATR